MLTKETCIKIAQCYQEIENANRIITDMAKIVEQDKDKTYPNLYNAFGERKGLQLGVPSGDNGQRLFDVNLDMGVKVIEQHIKDKNRRLEELMVIAKLELSI